MSIFEYFEDHDPLLQEDTAVARRTYSASRRAERASTSRERPARPDDRSATPRRRDARSSGSADSWLGRRRL